MTEVWRAVPGFEGAYEVSDQGRVRSLSRVITCVSARGRAYQYPVRGRTLRPGKASNGYLTVSLQRDGDRRSYLVQELVLLAFVGPRPKGCHICHNDGTRGNNWLTNLRYDTPAANSADADRHGTRIRGERYSTAKLTDDAVREIRRLHYKVPQSVLAERFGVSASAVQAVHDRRTWRHVS